MTDPSLSADQPCDSQETATGILGQLRAVIERLGDIDASETESRCESGRLKRGHSQIEYSYEISIGLDSGLDSQSHAGPAGGPEADEEAPIIDVRDTGETERVLVADLSEIPEDDVDVTLDPERGVLELWGDGVCIERVSLETRDIAITDLTHNNQILEVRLAPTDDTLTTESNGR